MPMAASAIMNWIAWWLTSGLAERLALAGEVQRVGDRALRQPEPTRADDRPAGVEREHRRLEAAALLADAGRPAETRQSCSTMLAVGTPITPILRSQRGTEKPGESVGTMKAEMPRRRSRPVFAK